MISSSRSERLWNTGIAAMDRSSDITFSSKSTVSSSSARRLMWSAPAARWLFASGSAIASRLRTSVSTSSMTATSLSVWWPLWMFMSGSSTKSTMALSVLWSASRSSRKAALHACRSAACTRRRSTTSSSGSVRKTATLSAASSILGSWPWSVISGTMCFLSTCSSAHSLYVGRR